MLGPTYLDEEPGFIFVSFICMYICEWMCICECVCMTEFMSMLVCMSVRCVCVCTHLHLGFSPVVAFERADQWHEGKGCLLWTH